MTEPDKDVTPSFSLYLLRKENLSLSFGKLLH